MTGEGHPGTVVLSIDAELGWGFVDLPSVPADRVQHARSGWQRLLALLDTHRIPATWAVVGHLYLDDCDGRHADHPAPDGWFARERDEWADRPDLRFGRDLVEAVESAAVDHEVACHGFSHVPFNHPEMTSALARAELEASHEAAGRSFDSFVFPRNWLGHLDALAEAGYLCYRGPIPHVPGTTRGKRAKLRQALVGMPPVVRPVVDEHGLVNLPASLPLFSFEGPGRRVLGLAVGDPIVRQVRAGVDAAARTGGVFHIWLHPNNITTAADVRRLETVFETVASARQAGRITVEPMGAVAHAVAREKGPPTP